MINKYSNGQRLAHRIPINKYHTKFRLTATTKLADEVIIVFDTPWLKNHNYQNLFLVCHYSTPAKLHIPVSQF